MFGSISNWINTNMPQVPPMSMPSMPNMPSMPKPNMPAMPDIFGKNKSAAPTEEQQANAEAAANVETKDTGAVEEPKKLEQEAGEIENVSNGDSTVAGEGEQANSKAGLMNPLDIDAQKALGTAKEIGSNIGSNIGLLNLLT